MGCNCKNKTSKMNNTSSVDHVNIAKAIYQEHILNKELTKLTELDIIQIYHAFNVLYPYASARPSVSDAINQIKVGIELYDVKYKR